MRFILTYDGPLPPNGNALAKNFIRRELHPQLEHLWQIEHSLSAQRGIHPVLRGTRNEHSFVPIVTVRHSLVCQLEVMLLQPGEPGTVIHAYGGDLDNRLKTLFDSLGVPDGNQLAGLPTLDPTTTETTTTYVLLEDDSRITRLGVQTEKLLRPPAAPDHVRVVMTVTVRPTKVTEENLFFLGGWIS
jgi:hypothetical protein